MALITPTAVACGSTVDVGRVPDSMGVSDAGSDMDASGFLRVSTGCGTWRSRAPCGEIEIADCQEDSVPRLVTRVEPLDCDPSRGFTADTRWISYSCDAAFAGESGQRCSEPRTCVRRAAQGCCLELAACTGGGSPLLRTRACALGCLRTSHPAVDSTFESCDALSDAILRTPDPAGDLLGAACHGQFACAGLLVGTETCHGNLACVKDVGDLTGAELSPTQSLRAYFCVEGRLQILDTLPWYDVPVLDASVPWPWPEAGFDAGDFGFDAGRCDLSELLPDGSWEGGCILASDAGYGPKLR